MHNIKYVKSHPVVKSNPNAFIVTVTAVLFLFCNKNTEYQCKKN